eukprot:3012260-Prymnesium_polylepis.1
MAQTSAHDEEPDTRRAQGDQMLPDLTPVTMDTIRCWGRPPSFAKCAGKDNVRLSTPRDATTRCPTCGQLAQL